MFEIGFWELALVGVVALLVFGPERLPRVARETALWLRKARNMVASVKEEINHELDLQDLRQSLLEQKHLAKTALDSLDITDPNPTNAETASSSEQIAQAPLDQNKEKHD